MEPKDLKVQPCGQLQREEHQVSLGQPIDQQGRREQGLLRNQGAKGFGLDHSPFFRPDRLLSLLLEQISSRLSRGCVGGGLYATRSSSKALQRSNSSTPDWYSVHGSIFIALPSTSPEPNQMERWLGIFTQQTIRRGSFSSLIAGGFRLAIGAADRRSPKGFCLQ